MLDENKIWAAAKAARGVVANTLKQITKQYVKAEPARQKAINRVEMWARKRFVRWQNVFAPLGYDKLTTSALANSLGRTNSAILKDLDNLVADGLVIRDGTQRHLCNGRDLQQWTWVGVRK